MFKTRLLSGILLVILALITVISGGTLLFGVLFLISMIGLYELYRVLKVENTLAGICGFLFSAGYYALLYVNSMLPTTINWMMMLFMAFMICLMMVFVFSFPKYKGDQIFGVFFGVFYVVVMMSYIYQTRMLPQGVFSVGLVFLCAWGCDTCAYCVGMLIGKYKMAPKLSPKKSIEGGIGGIVGAGLLAMLYALAVNHWANVEVSIVAFGIIGVVGGAISQIGDLAASAIKRNYEIKDYGKLIPGHGGILDRFDSIIFTAPIIFYLTVLM